MRFLEVTGLMAVLSIFDAGCCAKELRKSLTAEKGTTTLTPGETLGAFSEARTAAVGLSQMCNRARGWDDACALGLLVDIDSSLSAASAACVTSFLDFGILFVRVFGRD